jgi:hypothetical protein
VSPSRIFSQLLARSQDLAPHLEIPADIDWETTVRLAHQHCLASRLYRVLRQEGLVSLVPPSARESLLKAFLCTEGQHLLFGRWVRSLNEAFSNEEVPFCLLKGWGLAHRYYPFPTDRYFQDIDLLFSLETRNKVTKTLESLGFEIVANHERFFANAHKLEFSLKSNPSVLVECHFGMGPTWDFEKIWSRVKQTTVSSGDQPVTFSHLDSEDEYVYLAHHFAIQHRFQKLIWLLDLAQIRETVSLRARAKQSRRDCFGLRSRNDFTDRVPFCRAYEMMEYFLARHCEIGEPVREVPAYDKWFERIVLTSIDSSFFLKARLRALQSGGWGAVLRYGVAQKLARWTKATA